MAKLTPDATRTEHGLVINEKIIPWGAVWPKDSGAYKKGAQYKADRLLSGGTGKVKGVTIHNTNDLKNVEEDAEQYLAKRYAVPLAPAPRVINKFSKDIAVYNLFSRIGIDEGTDQKTYLNRYNAAIKFLTLVAEGTVSIGTETEDPASAAAGGFKVKSNSRLFTREKMRGM